MWWGSLSGVDVALAMIRVMVDASSITYHGSDISTRLCHPTSLFPASLGWLRHVPGPKKVGKGFGSIQKLFAHTNRGYVHTNAGAPILRELMSAFSLCRKF